MNEEEEFLKRQIRDIVSHSKGRYGYRRVTISLRNKGHEINHKRVSRIMKECNLQCTKFHRKSRNYSSYKGTIGKIANNDLNRKFNINHPNEVWVTDVTEFRVGEKKLYLSPILDLYNSEIISYSLSNNPTTKFTSDSLRQAISKLPKEHNLMIHSDQGFHYQHSSWVKTLEANNIKQSMSRKGNCLDNSPMENFFGILKQEMYYGETYKSTIELESDIRDYIEWYNNERIKTKLKGFSPIQYRQESIHVN